MVLTMNATLANISITLAHEYCLACCCISALAIVVEAVYEDNIYIYIYIYISYLYVIMQVTITIITINYNYNN